MNKLQYKPQTIKSRFAAIKGYLKFLGVKMYTEDCKQIIEIPKDIKERETPLTKDSCQRWEISVIFSHGDMIG